MHNEVGTCTEIIPYLLYSEGVSKTNQGGFNHRKLTPRSSRAYANAECPERCVVGIVDTYMKRCPKDSLLNAFYLKPLQKFKGKSVWYSTVPLGHNKLNSMEKIMMSEDGVEGYYTNHSLRATAVSRLSQNEVDDKLIKGVTGHRSDALQGPVVQKSINTNPRLRLNQGVYFSTPKCSSTLIFDQNLH